MAGQLLPLEQERNQFGYNTEEVRGKQLRIIKRSKSSDGESQCCVFFVHGGGGRACQFKHQITAIQEVADVIAFDFLGHGESPAPNQPDLYTEEEHLQDLHEIFMRYKKENNFIVAHCYGSVHTLRLMKILRDNDLISCVKGIVLIALGTNTPASRSILMRLPAGILEYLRPFARSSSNAALFTPQTSPDLIAFENSISNNNRMYAMKVLGYECSDQDLWTAWLAEGKAGLGEDVPVGIMCGEGDGVFSVEQCKDTCQFLGVPQDRFESVANVGHLVMLEAPDKVTVFIKKFIEPFLSE